MYSSIKQVIEDIEQEQGLEITSIYVRRDGREIQELRIDTEKRYKTKEPRY